MKQLESIAQSFYQFFTTGVFHPEIDDISQLSLEDAYACQRHFIKKRREAGNDTVGYKVGCTSAAVQEQFGITQPIYGRLATPGIIAEGEPVVAADYYDLAIEPEFVITLGRDLETSQLTDDELLDCIDNVRAGIELHNYRYHYSSPSIQELICSNGIHASLIVGGETSSPHLVDWEMEGVAVFINGCLVASGVAADIMGGPLHSLRFLLRHLESRGEVLQAGEMVIPGSATPLIHVNSGDQVICRFANLGKVETTFG